MLPKSNALRDSRVKSRFPYWESDFKMRKTAFTNTYDAGVLRTSFLYLTLCIAGGVILVIEIAGTRILAPFFDATVFVWSSLITTILGFLPLAERMNTSRKILFHKRFELAAEDTHHFGKDLYCSRLKTPVCARVSSFTVAVYDLTRENLLPLRVYFVSSIKAGV